MLPWAGRKNDDALLSLFDDSFYISPLTPFLISLNTIDPSRRAAAYGAKVGLIETQRLGGTCVNIGILT